MAIWRFLLVLFYLISSSIAQPSFLYHFCVDTYGNYTENSTYKANLDAVLSDVFSDTQIDYGFYNLSVGQDPDRANVIGLCRGDVSVADCLGCLNNSVYELRKVCPNQKEAIGWHDECMLRFSNRSIFQAREDLPRFYISNVNNASDVDQFNDKLSGLVEALRDKASSGDSKMKFDMGQVNIDGFTNLYSYMQCTPDLSQLDCYNCLERVRNDIPNCCYAKEGGRFFSPSCTLRYEIYAITTSSNASVSSPPPPSSPSSLTPSAVTPMTPSSPPNPGKGKGSDAFKIVLIVGSVTITTLLLIIFVIFCLRQRRQALGKVSEEESVHEDEISTIESLQFDFRRIKSATANFSEANRLGRGGFGVVYKGVLGNGKEIAVKRLDKNSTQGEQEFKNEVLLVAKLQHRNLVRLLGFCYEREERLLMYEYMPNASLDNFLFDASRRANLDWHTRYKIIEGIGRGLRYLHEDSRLKIIHRDLKSSNILLGVEMNPKISDFGTARLFQEDQSQAATVRIAGTFGYMAPEYALHGLFSVKSDVYSFGVLVLEILSGQNNTNFSNGENDDSLITMLWRKWRQGRIMDVVDHQLKGGPRHGIMRCIHIGLLCVQEEAEDRPTMSSVVVMFSNHTVSLPVPSRPAYVVNRSLVSDRLPIGRISQASSKPSRIRAKGSMQTVNEASVTDLNAP